MDDSIHYIHNTTTHNTTAAEAFLPILFEKTGLPHSVVDVGCGIGTWLSVFKKLGVQKILGIDGDNVDVAQLHIDRLEFKIANLVQPLALDERYGLAVCLEVAEHLPAEAADTLVESLCGLSDTILFSAALPKQGGQNHINEQYFDYWRKKFNARGYLFEDTFRSSIWNDERIDSWYRQNMFLVKKIGNGPLSQPSVDTYYHPEIFAHKAKIHESAVAATRRLADGELRIPSAGKILLKSILRSFK